MTRPGHTTIGIPRNPKPADLFATIEQALRALEDLPRLPRIFVASWMPRDQAATTTAPDGATEYRFGEVAWERVVAGLERVGVVAHADGRGTYAHAVMHAVPVAGGCAGVLVRREAAPPAWLRADAARLVAEARQAAAVPAPPGFRWEP